MNLTIDINATLFESFMPSKSPAPTHLPTYNPVENASSAINGCIIESRFNNHEWIWFGILYLPCLILTLIAVGLIKNESKFRSHWSSNTLTIIFTSFMITSISSVVASTIYLSQTDKYSLCDPYFVTKDIGDLRWLSKLSPFVNSNKNQIIQWWIACSLGIIFYLLFWIAKYYFDDELTGTLKNIFENNEKNNRCQIKCFCFGKIDFMKVSLKLISVIILTVLSYSIVSIFQPYFAIGYNGIDKSEKCLCIDRYTNEFTSTLFTMIVAPFVSGLMYYIVSLTLANYEDSTDQSTVGCLCHCTICFIAGGYGIFMFFLFVVSPIYMIVLRISSIITDIHKFNDDFQKYFSLEYGIIFVILIEGFVAMLISFFCQKIESINSTKSVSEGIATEINLS